MTKWEYKIFDSTQVITDTEAKSWEAYEIIMEPTRTTYYCRRPIQEDKDVL